jgi:phosphoesterase RecJ-like protein
MLLDGGAVACSFRSIPGFDVSRVAFDLGGGGHTQASGCTLRGITLESAVEKVIPMLKAEVLQGKSVYA